MATYWAHWKRYNIALIIDYYIMFLLLLLHQIPIKPLSLIPAQQNFPEQLDLPTHPPSLIQLFKRS